MTVMLDNGRLGRESTKGQLCELWTVIRWGRHVARQILITVITSHEAWHTAWTPLHRTQHDQRTIYTQQICLSIWTHKQPEIR